MLPRNADVSYLELILGPMYSGKTSRIIYLYEYCIEHKISVCVYWIWLTQISYHHFHYCLKILFIFECPPF